MKPIASTETKYQNSTEDYSFNLFPYFKRWTEQFGRTFSFAIGRTQYLYVADPELVKEINRSTSYWDMGKPDYLQKDRAALLGKGLLGTSSEVWYHQRKTIAPQLYMDKIKLKMIILEIMRLYPGVAFWSRKVLQDLKLGSINVPKGVNIWVWILALHRDPDLWGPDAYEFNPKRFANGISSACKSPHAYMPFGAGARVCPGQSLALTELKVLFALVLSNFSLTISPTCRHSPKFGLLLEPECGVNLLIEKILSPPS